MVTPEQGIGGGLVLTGLIAALTAFFRYGLPALRNGRNGGDVAEALKDLRASLDELSDALDHVPKDVVAGVREALASTVAQIDVAAREREVERQRRVLDRNRRA